jgi:hypothetical protein
MTLNTIGQPARDTRALLASSHETATWANQALVQLTLVRIREFIREPEALFWTLLFPICWPPVLASPPKSSDRSAQDRRRDPNSRTRSERTCLVWRGCHARPTSPCGPDGRLIAKADRTAPSSIADDKLKAARASRQQRHSMRPEAAAVQ